MNKTINFNELPDLTNILGLCIPDGTVETFESDDLKCRLEKDNGHLKIEIEANIPECDGEFDDSATKEIVDDYKENIKALDDDLFLEIVDELKSKVNLTRFNELLNLEKFDEDQAQEVEEMIDISTDVICLHLQHNIQDMVVLYGKF
jgi:hypothetical protein